MCEFTLAADSRNGGKPHFQRGCKVSVVVRISSMFTVVLCKGSAAALETPTGKCWGGGGAAGGLGQGQNHSLVPLSQLAASESLLFSRAG